MNMNKTSLIEALIQIKKERNQLYSLYSISYYLLGIVPIWIYIYIYVHISNIHK